MLRPLRRSRSGTTCVEFAAASLVAFFIVLSLVVGGLGVFRYQEVAHLAREGARFAPTHGGQYTQDGIAKATGVSAIATSDDMRAYLLPRSALLDPASLTITASWSGAGTVTPSNMPTYITTASAEVTIQNYVTVTVTYQWLPEAYLVGPITLTSTSTMAMSY